MNLDDALNAHAKWKVKFRSAIEQQDKTLDATSIAKDDTCDFGKWLHGPGKTEVGRLPDYATCVKEHAAFHTEAGKVARAINAGKFNEAATMLNAGTSYDNASKSVGVAIMRLRREAK
jgi:methyl-accepting chemotaxis protein